MFKIIKAGIPYLPDWLFKRPHLNHNNITKPFLNILIPTSKVFDSRSSADKLGSFPLDL